MTLSATQYDASVLTEQRQHKSTGFGKLIARVLNVTNKSQRHLQAKRHQGQHANILVNFFLAVTTKVAAASLEHLQQHSIRVSHWQTGIGTGS